MKVMLALAAFFPLLTMNSATSATFSDLTIHTGMCDASAAVALDSDHFVVANDEDNQLRIYRRGESGPPRAVLDLSPFLELEDPSRETDLEGAAQIGDIVYWISSHARNKSGKLRPNRYRFLGTRFSRTGDTWKVEPVGRPYKALLADFLADPRLAQFELAEASTRPPKTERALNIEGLAATPDGRLLIGFRNPIPDGRALIVPLGNPQDLLQGRAARFEAPLLLELDGLGIREMAACDGRYIIAAGAYDEDKDFKLFEWDGRERVRMLTEIELGEELRPECVVFYPGLGCGTIQLISDDGSRRIDGTKCKDIQDPERRHFREVMVELPSAAGR